MTYVNQTVAFITVSVPLDGAAILGHYQEHEFFRHHYGALR